MEIKDIQNLIKFVAKSGASEVSLETEDIKITIKTPSEHEGSATVVQQIPMPAATAPAPVAPVAEAAPAPVAEAPAAAPADDDSKYVAIKSPIIGTFYRRPSPDKDAFVNVGDEVKSGTVVAMVEAMKLFNEIESEISGKIVKVLVEDNSPVEYDQPLFLVDPS